MKSKTRYITVNIYKASDKKDRRKSVTLAVQRCINRKAAA